MRGGWAKEDTCLPPTLELPCIPELGLVSHSRAEQDKHNAEVGAVPNPTDRCTGELQAADFPHTGEALFRGPGPGLPPKPTPSH